MGPFVLTWYKKVNTELKAFRMLLEGVHMEKAGRRKYTDEFKEGAVKLITDQGYKISEAARNLGIHTTQLRRWVKGTLPDSNPAPAKISQLQAELNQLRREKERLRMEREILKKATAFFAKKSV